MNNNKTDIEKILPLVQRPARYINHEWNSSKKEKKAGMASICFCFPDLYEVGASGLGIEILYHLVNERDDFVAERCFSPAPDMAAALRAGKMPLFSLESRTPLPEFDIIGFSLPYELVVTNVLELLDLAGLPVLAEERKDAFPLVIGGGPLTANPEPIADFFDAFVLGDGEEVTVELLETVRAFRAKRSGDKQELLRTLAKIPGVYVPSMYQVAYRPDGTIASVTPARAEVPACVEKRTVKLEEAYFPAGKIVPYLQTIHNRLNIEVARGCPRQCRFCQAARYYWPWRVRSAEKILALAQEGLALTGYEEIAFSSLSCTDYRELGKLLSEFNRRYGGKRVSVSLPSLRCDQFSVKVAQNLNYGKRSNLTFAPEAGTERLRNAIGKGISQQEIEETLLLAARLGWKTVKLYFMVGLPTETGEDIEGINRLVRSVRKSAPGLNFSVTVSPFVPKPQTAFQWAPMTPPETLADRIRRLRKILPATVKSHFIEGSVLEGVIARADRRMAAAIRRAWEKGCRFDQWKEHFRYDLWQEAFRETGIDASLYLSRERSVDEILPWDHLSFGTEKNTLAAQYRQSAGPQKEAGEKSAAPPRELSVPVPPPPPPLPKAVVRLRMRFARKGVVRFLSHLEQIEVFRRTLRRVDAPLTFTAGFSPQPRVAFGPAISVGYESRSEYVEAELASNVDLNDFAAKMNAVLPDGFALLSVKKIPHFFPSLDSLVNVADYELSFPVPEEMIRRFLERTEIIFEKRKEGRSEKIDVRPLVRALSTDGKTLFLQLRFGPKKNVKPERILQLMTGMDDGTMRCVPVTRSALLIEKRDGALSEP